MVSNLGYGKYLGYDKVTNAYLTGSPQITQLRCLPQCMALVFTQILCYELILKLIKTQIFIVSRGGGRSNVDFNLA